MKKQVFIIIFYISILLLMLTGCKREGEEPNKFPGDQSVDLDDDQSVDLDDESNNNTTWNQPDTVIRWGIPDILKVSDDILNEFNQSLTKKGHDFMVEFIPLDYDNYYEALKKYEKNHESLDIAYAGLNTSFDNQSYNLIKSGYFISLDDYLRVDKSSNDKGEELYNLFDPLLWDSIKVDGSIYSIPNGVAKEIGEKFVFNKKYITHEELQDFTGDISQLKEYMERIPMKDDFSHLVYGLELFDFTNLIECDYRYGLILSHEVKGAHNPFEVEKVKEYYRTFQDYYKSGYINYNLSFSSNEKQEEMINEYLRSGNFFVYVHNEGFKDIEINAEVYTIDTGVYMRSRLSGTTGIAMESTKKDEAFELLSLVHTDKEFANLLVYGRKGVDYQLVDGIAYDMDGGSPSSFINELLLGIYENVYPTQEENFVVDRLTDKREYYKNHVKPSPYLGLHLDINGYESIIKDITNIIEESENIDIWKSDNLEAEFERVAKLLKDAGIDDLIVDVNKQLGVD